ncbi:Synaptotagmin-5 [Camellia lanceoleosa]|uniref:Synaptotagmin-5 n=1 Tax=Camellia lanceoleosa TaxID=1840588 RepID=A0ACC0GBW9_9ERIC|nr:Synaptotagmin-5 [Camellia lanceoleosa]
MGGFMYAYQNSAGRLMGFFPNEGEVHLELLYYPFGMKNGFTNPFASNFSMTSLEKFLKSGVEGKEASENGMDVKHKRREVIVRVVYILVISAKTCHRSNGEG